MKEKIMLVGLESFTSVTGGVITVFNSFIQMLERNGYTVIPQYDTTPEVINGAVREKKPDLMIFFFPELLRRSHLSAEFNSIPRILMFHSRPDFYFAMSHGLERRLKKYYINTRAQILMESFRTLLPSYIRQEPVYVIPNPVTIPLEKADYTSEHKKAVFFSRIDPCKGVDLLTEAFELVVKKHNDWSVDIYGDCDVPGYMDSIKAAIKAKGLENNVIIKGVASNKVLVDYDFCVFPSRFEGFGLGLAESMAAGLPCIGLENCSAVNEIIQDNVNGILCEDNAESLAQAITKLIEDPGLRKKLGTKARESISKYSPELVERKWMDLIEAALTPLPSHGLVPAGKLAKLYRSAR